MRQKSFIPYLGLSISQALMGITNVAAKSLGESNVGVIKKNASADLVITNCDLVDEILYDWTKHPIEQVLVDGEIVK